MSVLDQVQIIMDNDEARFAIISYEEFLFLRELLNDEEKLADYLDYLHAKQVKADSSERFNFEEVLAALGLDAE